MLTADASAVLPHERRRTKTLYLLRQDRDHTGNPVTLAIFDEEWKATDALRLLQKADTPGALDIEPLECWVGAVFTAVHQ